MFGQACCERGREGVDPCGGLRAGRDGQYCAGHPAAELGPAEGGDVRPAVVLQPGTGACGEQGRGDRVEAPGQALAGDEDVGGDLGAHHGPQGPRPAQPRLHLVGDVERPEAVAELTDAREVAGVRHGEPDRGGDRLEDDRGRGGGGQRLLECGQVVERDLGELLVAAGGQEGPGCLAVTGRQRQPGVPVVGTGHGDDPATPGRTAGGLDRQVDRLTAAAGEHGVGHPGGALDEVGREQRPFHAGEVVVADVERRPGRRPGRRSARGCGARG